MGDRCCRRKKAPRKFKAASDANIDSVPDELLELVFLRLPLPLDLVRAASTCRRWRNVIIADGGRLIRFLHGDPFYHVAGHYRVKGCMGSPRPPGRNPVFIPSLSSPWAGRLTAKHHALDFLRRSEFAGFSWELADSRGGILLFLLLKKVIDLAPAAPRFVVCDPLTRCYRTLPLSGWFHGCSCLGAFLLDGMDASACISMSHFRIACVLYRNGYGMARACMFASVAGGRWTSGSTAVCGTAGCRIIDPLSHISFARNTHGSAHWNVREHTVLSLNKYTAQLSVSVWAHRLWRNSQATEYSYQPPWPPSIRACPC